MNVLIHSRSSRFFVLALFLLLISLPLTAVAALPEFTAVIKKTAPAVVNVSSRQWYANPNSLAGQPYADILQNLPGRSNTSVYRSQSLGSGFIVSADGYILTNAHVVEDADEVIVTLHNRKEYKADIIGTDKRTDLALLKINADHLPTVEFADSDKLQVGEWVLAIGSPFGLSESATSGIVSAIGRNLPSESYVPFIQTDVAINLGNSGGPLFNLDARVVGINSQIYSRTGGYMGLSFAIPSNLAQRILQQLKDKGQVTHGYLGVLVQDISADLAMSFGLSEPDGALVVEVLPGSPAARAGLFSGDVIVAFNRQAVRDSAALPPLVGVAEINQDSSISVIRSGQKKRIIVQIADLEAGSTPQKPRVQKTQARADPRFGLVVEDLDDVQRDQVKPYTGGVEVQSVVGDAARSAGIRKGDIVLAIDNVRVVDMQSFQQIIQALPAGKMTAVLVYRDGQALFVAVKSQD
ncbi:MAG: Do family serine endopeptidase [gamma proteobacterium symbiont of Bathyaustriella thionipta]|nr:Do family serine endopeptidase [gamma proteobacterium symbiont of Bathyaustriella thionipta]